MFSSFSFFVILILRRIGRDTMNINDINAVNEIKALGLDMISQAKSGHPGIVLSAAPIIYTLYARHMNINPENPEWTNRDRFVLSAGHGSALLYATLHLCGYPITKEDLKNFRSVDFKTPGHPEYGITPGVDISTGMLGQGIANAVGMAMAERYIRNIMNSEDEAQELIDYRTYVLCGDGDLMEGISYEAASFAGAQKLEKLMILYDCNKMTNDGGIDTVFLEDIELRFEAMGFYVDVIKDGTNLKSIDKAISAAKKSKKPSILIFHTILGKDSMNENKSVVHGAPLSDDDVFQIKRKLNITVAPFDVRKDTVVHVHTLISDRIRKKYESYVAYVNKIKSSGNDRILHLLRMLANKEFQIPFESLNYRMNDTYNEELRLTNHKVLNLVAGKSELILGGSADLASSTKAYIDQTSIQSSLKPLGRNINFGVREHAMAAILNGMSISGLKTYCSTMLAFGDYLKPAMRMSALMELPVTYIFTHDSIAIGEDGPTHEPIEQLTMLRSIPNMITFRPCDVNEVFGCWEYICKNSRPINLVLSKKNVPKLMHTNPKLVQYGAYVVGKEERKLDGVLIATGSEVQIAMRIKDELKMENLDLRVVSMPSMELFLKESKEYQNQLLPASVPRIVIEPSSKLGWGLFVDDEKYILGLNDFGYSGHMEDVLKKSGYDYETLKMRVVKLLLRNN